jgi:adenosylcobyric acid synthase
MMMVKGIMIQGTASNVGKSFITTGFCRIFSDLGYKTAPFKSQNMSNNSYVTFDGKEIGRAQGIQAEAARTEATVYMNPILLKPRNETHSEVVLFGKSYDTFSGQDYRNDFYEKGLSVIQTALNELSNEYDLLVVEGAGSPVEVNLKDRDLVNMKVAELADVPVILVTDIERGGVFASIVGTLALLEPHERKRVKGVIINKFRGDISLFQSGVEWIEKQTGIKVLGVLPYLDDHQIDGEDSLSIRTKVLNNHFLDISVIRHPYISNFTDVEPFLFEEDVAIRWVDRSEQLGHPDAVIIPGTRSTIHDLQTLKKRGLDQALVQYVENGGTVVGICGGYQMLSEKLLDPYGADSGVHGLETEGIGLLPVQTIFFKEKKTKRIKGMTHPTVTIDGYEIHTGITQKVRDDERFSPFLFDDENGQLTDGWIREDGAVIGTYVHHLFHNDEWRTFWLNQLRRKKGLPEQKTLLITAKKDKQYDCLADHIRTYVNIDEIVKLATGKEG